MRPIATRKYNIADSVVDDLRAANPPEQVAEEKSEISDYDMEFTPPDFLLDKYHPHNQGYFKEERQIKALLVTLQAKMKPRHVEISKMAMQGKDNEYIAEHTGLQKTSISQIKARDDVKQLTDRLRYFQALQDGPNISHRKRVLTEIMIDSQEHEPKISIAAIQEMNKMDGVGKDVADKKIEITINQNQFPRGPLDVA